MTERKLAAIMFTDLVGYVALSQRNEALALELLKEHQELLRPLFTQHHGTEIKTMGDAFLVEFASAVEAARCAVDIQKALTAHTSVVTPERRIQVRIGLHVGDVVVEGDDVLGDGVNIASRIEPLAEPGGICISEDVARQVRNKIDGSLEKLGERKLKGIAEPVTVYRLVLPWEKAVVPSRLARLALRKPISAPWIAVGLMAVLVLAAVIWWQSSRRMPTVQRGEITSIAVLPLDNLMGDPDQDYFVDGMHEALTAELSKISALRVIGRTSTMSYKANPKPIPEIAAELNVDAVIEGSVLRAGDRVRVTVQLVATRPERHLWSESYDRDLRDILKLHSDVAQAIAAEIKVAVTPEEEARLAESKEVHPEAYQAYLLGRQFVWKLYAPDVWRGIALFEKAIQLDSTYADAYVGLAHAYWRLAVANQYPSASVWPHVIAAGSRALDLDDNLAGAHEFQAIIKDDYEWDRPAAEKEFLRALELDPANANLYWNQADIHSRNGRPIEALESINQAIELDPHYPFYYCAKANLFLKQGQDDEALNLYEYVLDTYPSYPFTHWFLAHLYAQQGRYSDAVGEVEKSMILQGEDNVGSDLPLLGYLFAKLGRTAEARQQLKRLDAFEAAGGYVPPFARSWVYIGLGEIDAALALLELAMEERHPYLHSLHPSSGWYWFHHLFTPLQDDPRYLAIQIRLGFSP